MAVIGRAFAFLAVLLILMLVWVWLYDTHRFITVRYSVPRRDLQASTRIVQLSDLHGGEYGRDNEALIQAVRAEHPDIIVCTGDMYADTKAAAVNRLLRRLCEIAPVYFVYGNHENKTHAYSRYWALPAAIRSTGATLLRNAHIDLPWCNVSIYGLELRSRLYGKRFEYGIKLPSGYLEQMLGKPDRDRFNILLAHEPKYMEQYAQWGADLILSGHVHGGLVRIGGRGIVSPSFALFPKYDGGEYSEYGSHMIISRGLGGHFPTNIRIFNPAELVVIDLEPIAEGS